MDVDGIALAGAVQAEEGSPQDQSHQLEELAVHLVQNVTNTTAIKHYVQIKP